MYPCTPAIYRRCLAPSLPVLPRIAPQFWLAQLGGRAVNQSWRRWSERWPLLVCAGLCQSHRVQELAPRPLLRACRGQPRLSAWCGAVEAFWALEPMASGRGAAPSCKLHSKFSPSRSLAMLSLRLLLSRWCQPGTHPKQLLLFDFIFLR